MSEGEKGERLDFEVCFCSGEDPDYPASELQREQSKGWQSPRFCEYPQLNQLQLLSHQSKISQRIELYIGDGKPTPGASRQQYHRPAVERVRRGGGPVVPSPEPSSFDRETAQKLRELREMKLVAIEREDYDEAKRIKMEEQVLNELGTKLASLEAEKRRAVELEDYDTAKMLKLRMDALRRGESSVVHHAVPPARQQQIDHRVEEDVSIDEKHTIDRDFKQSMGSAGEQQQQQQVQDPRDQIQFPGNRRNKNRPFPGDAGQWSLPADTSNNGDMSGMVSSPARMMDQEEEEEEGFGDGPHPLEGVEGYADLPHAPKLPKGKVGDAEPITRAFGDYVARCAFAKRAWALRKAAMKKAAMSIGKSDESDDVVFRGVCRLLKIASKDRVAQVFVAALELQEKVLENPPSSMSKRSVVDSLKTFMDAIVERVCTGNSRTQKLAKRTLMDLAFHDAVGAAAVAQIALRPLPRKQLRQPKAVLHRLEVIKELLQEHHSDASAGFGPGPVIQFVKACKSLENREAYVRDAGANVIAMCHQYYGESVRSHLRGLDKKSLAKVESILGSGGSTTSAAVSSSPAVVPKPRSADKSRSKKKRTGGRNRKGGRGGRRQGGGRREAETKRGRDDDDDDDDLDRDFEDDIIDESKFKSSVQDDVDDVGVVDDDEDVDSWAEEKRRMREEQEDSIREQQEREDLLRRAEAELENRRREDEEAKLGDVDDDVMNEDEDEDVQPFTCPFCGQYDPSFDDEGLDTHFWKECPMLTSCPKCEQVIEICDLNEHLLEECAHKSECKQCPRCREAIAIAFYEVHTQRRKCLPATDTTVRCPLCHVNIGDLTDDSVDHWRRHLLEEGCTKNPRIQSSY